MEKSLTKAFSDILRIAAITLIGRVMAALLGLIVSIIIARTYGAAMTGLLGIIVCLPSSSWIPNCNSKNHS